MIKYQLTLTIHLLILTSLGRMIKSTLHKMQEVLEFKTFSKKLQRIYEFYIIIKIY